MEEKGIIRSIRGNKEVFDRLADITKANFSNQGEALEALVNAWDLQQAKTATPNRKTEIEDFDAHLQALSTAYLHSLQIAESADTRARNALSTELASKDALIRDLQAQLEVARTSAKLAEQERREAEAEARNAKKALETAERQASDANARADAAEHHAAAQIADKEKLVHSLTAQVADLSERARENAAAIEQTKNLREKLAAVNRQLEDAQTAAAIADAKALADKTLAVSAAREETSTRLLQLTDENAALRVELERAKAKITLLESPKETQAANAAPMNEQQTPPTPATDTSNAAKRQKAAPKRGQKKAAQTPAPAEESKEIPGLTEARNLIDAWAQYQKAFQTSFEGEGAVGGMTDIPEPPVTVEEHLKQYPAAAAYLRAEAESLKSNYEIASIGKRALERIKANPDDYAAAIAQMDADFSAFSNRHMWD